MSEDRNIGGAGGDVVFYVAAKAFRMGAGRGRLYRVGERVNVAALPDRKIGQLIDQRFITPTTT